MMQPDTAEKWHDFKLADAAITVTEQGTNPLWGDERARMRRKGEMREQG